MSGAMRKYYDDKGCDFKMFNNENENKQLCYEKNNQKILANSGVQLYFSNVFDQTVTGKLPTIKNKLRKILVDFGMCQICLEIDQRLNFIKVHYRDEQTTELKGLLLQRFNQNKQSQAIELNINLEVSLVTLPEVEKGIKTYTGLTKLLFQEFIQLTKSRSLVDNDSFNEMRNIIKQGNLASTLPLSAILIEGVD